MRTVNHGSMVSIKAIIYLERRCERNGAEAIVYREALANGMVVKPLFTVFSGAQIVSAFMKQLTEK